MRALKMRSTLPGHQKLTVTIERIVKSDPLTTTQRVAEALSINHSTVIGHLKQIGKMENSINGCLTSWPKTLKKSSLWSVFSFYETANHFSIRLWHALKSGLYTTTNNDQLSGWIKKKIRRTFQNQTCTKEMFMVTVWGSAAHLIHHTFLNPGETITSRSMLSKIGCAVNCNTCSQRWSTERAQLFSTTTPDCMSHNQCFKSWTNWVTRFCLICHIHLLSCQLTTTSSSISTTLCSENASTTSRRRKMLSQSLSNPEGWIFLL